MNEMTFICLLLIIKYLISNNFFFFFPTDTTRTWPHSGHVTITLPLPSESSSIFLLYSLSSSKNSDEIIRYFEFPRTEL